MPAARISLALSVLTCLLYACAPEFDAGDGEYKFYLNKNIHVDGVSPYQVYWQLQDTARWRRLRAAADTVVPPRVPGLPDGNLKFRSDRIWYQATWHEGGWRSREHYPGFVRSFDSVAVGTTLLRGLDNHRVRVEIPAQDIVLHGDSLRLGIVRTLGPAFPWSYPDYTPRPDQVVLTTWGNDTMLLSQDMAAVGTINRQTVLRVGQRHYALRYITPEYDGVILQELTEARGLPVTASLDLTYRAVPVVDLTGRVVNLRRTPGRPLMLLFWDGFDPTGRVAEFDRRYHTSPGAKDRLDLAFVSLTGSPDYLRTLREELGYRTPFYLGTPKTCAGLNCSAYRPYGVLIDGRGRVQRFGMRGRALERFFGRFGE